MNQSKPMSLTYACIAGLALYFIAMGSCRYCYPPALPLMVSEHWTTLSEAGFLGSGNFLGYLLGVFFSALVARHLNRARLVLGIVIVVVITTVLCAWNFGFIWLLFWRFINGWCGGALMVLAPSLILARVEEHRKGLVGGIMFAGGGLSMVLFSELVPVFNRFHGLHGVWVGFALVTLVMVFISLKAIMTTTMPLLKKPARDGAGRSPAAMMVLYWGAAAYFMFGMGITPHNLFLSDYAREAVGVSLTMSSLLYAIQGVGTIFGSILAGFLRDWLGGYKAILLMVSVCIIGIIVLLALHSPLGVGLSAFLVGIPSISVVLLMSLHVDEMVGTEHHAHYWSKITLCFAIGLFLGSCGFSWLLGTSMAFIDIFWIGLVLMFVTLGLYTRMK